MDSSDKYTPVIGLEIHAELKTASKMFCGCKNNPDEERPNVNICPICLGHPGTLPILNMEAIKHVLKIGLAVGSTIADFTEWDRKNYFYPDIPKGYQISQYKYPLVSGGELAGSSIERIHLEEDTAQSTHDTHEKSLINFNRAGVPLMELVTKPVIHDAETAVRFAKELQLLLRYLDAGEANMEKGEMRVEANISVRRALQNLTSRSDLVMPLGTKTEVKNLNSFRAVERAIQFEIRRQTSLLESGRQVQQETRGWDEKIGETFSQRSKESSHDYRYFPDPDIPKLKLSLIPEFDYELLKKELPELPWIKRDRYKKSFNVTDKEAAVFVDSPVLSDYFESIIKTYPNDQRQIKLTVNYLLSDYLGLLKKKGLVNFTTTATKIIPAKSFAELIDLVASAKLSSRGAKDVLSLLDEDPTASPQSLADKHGLIQNNDHSNLVPIIDKIMSEHPTVVAEYKAGKTASLQFLIGQTMRASKGSGNPEVIRKLLMEKLGQSEPSLLSLDSSKPY
ncbi:MAG: glutaminyl-tRNA synthase (glutamine-hydrolyzing) subunit B [Candidatus Taylorbacteria bacterium RIFCSPHIGHO2_02_FULL_45_28]|uniref:Aspartyl/glutamyl-tRNA(Asn/Gln) amidotransferase subunit B n=1 Tax=Candidatus Taylorbacteria bacterium RIFCSPHIGHO2_12_FULL_45_16 TaxID=1802315 RepID=A0A1G2N081_9BACT|nr:MAG: glutaminyl-tRNA synthase (glutamine-hydrolyzing) subunit B [Candidatus Taylorbacteria bacterium RIFCSPHIGHO2_01_FULL_44_110]OHA25251.1 MAG: glutaminyl-tRNA synthase (glutamine-hydrolyzing) subunit B [Candidatus Taylorbacteria bacterium RIFCSPHIGHO2_02_FULL_45_28]OHA29494.1 MAG: glutaminyl-tRNA synthase (glutamine-hydrolyzing) subunit B [Candidatus Taylorbacteria bacterium RIFCSPHIGHO2_12_FULL_45_16]OHA33256.1 MAG: glutaminyl-tRNA synthase (glutamine-hydrolyzing) subunit B [Candidatus Tay